MEGLLVALNLIIGLFGGHSVTSDGAHDTTTTTLIVPSVPAVHAVEQDLCKCDKIHDTTKRNLCYAKASSDPFFCERINNQELKDECYKAIQK